MGEALLWTDTRKRSIIIFIYRKNTEYKEKQVLYGEKN